MSAVPDTRCQILREGYLDVKAPPDSPERILHKAWRRLWVIAAVFIPKGRGEPHVILEFSRKEGHDEPLKRVKASRDGLRLFRCNSSSRPLRTWALSSGSSLLVYLAAMTEGETQDWMETIRGGLWPPIHSTPALSGECYDVSLIDDEKSFVSGLLGVYGRLVKTSDDAMSVIHPHWQGTQMRWLLTDIVGVRLVRKIGRAEDDAGVFNLSVKSSKKDTRILQFYSKTASATVEWISFILENSKSSGTTKSSKARNKTESVPVDQASNPKTTYAVVQKSTTIEQLQKEETPPTKDSKSDDSSSKTKPAAYLKLGNLPSAFLNASMNSPCIDGDGNASSSENESKFTQSSIPGDNSDDDEDAFVELYDHIYEDLNHRRASRSDTVYEEVDDAEGEYIPPMPPTPPVRQNPVLPERPSTLHIQPHSIPTVQSSTPEVALRLQKLSESVTEALKIVEQKPTEETRSGLRRKVSKKSKSLQQSPTVEVKSPPAVSSECQCIVHRAHSESDLKNTPLNKKQLPLRPFNSSPGCTSLQKKEREPQREQEVKAHAPLADLLKSLQTKSVLPTASTDETRKQMDLKSTEIPRLHITTTEIPTQSSPGGTEAEYLDMR